MSAVESPEIDPTVPNGVKNRRNSTILNPRSSLTAELLKRAPVFLGSTNFEPLQDAKNILVTGGAGFIACWFVRHLVLTYPHNYNVISFDKLDYCASLNNTRVLDGRPNFAFEQGDITSPNDVKRVLRKHNIDTIFHFAAQSHVDLSFGNSYQFTNTNVYGTHVLLERARQHGINRFVHISTDEVYGDVPIGAANLSETSLLTPTNPYAASKAAAEMMVSAFRSSFKLPLITVRSNNVYGPHQFPEKIIPKFIMLLQRRKQLLLHGDGSPTRRYVYAGDLVDALDTIFHKGQIGQIYNISSKDEISNKSICHKLLQIFNLPHSTEAELEQWVQHTEDRPFNDQRYATDGTKLAKLGWRQKTSFEEGLRITVDWYRQFGEVWWGDITRVLTAFPVVEGTEIWTKEEHEALPSDEEVGPEENGVVWTKKALNCLQASGGTV
ncbi:NAD(P)-binding protein [Sporormia fimetaria CBS 119925]|uniref:NAD(P)-binding protein n=1 Tax=Sporormia fimetaria CBS 119925 TaxID=1340428 RepID=A0A6A6VM18_9PLEO|nr:NAD(P)-binding protein [Sporormia fimetaria CBS 119925]